MLKPPTLRLSCWGSRLGGWLGSLLLRVYLRSHNFTLVGESLSLDYSTQREDFDGLGIPHHRTV